MTDRYYYAYILTNRRNGYFYTGITNNLLRRMYEHKHGLVEGYTRKHGTKTLVYYEQLQDATEAIKREKLIKKWRRSIKIEAIERMNPSWRDLYEEVSACV